MPNIEELLRKAIEEGKFDNLSGKGKPLRIEENPNADPDWELAYHLIKESGFTLPWIITIREIEMDIEKARQVLQRAWKWRMIYLSADVPDEKASAEWVRALDAFKNKLPALNQRVRDYNLEVPNIRFQRPLLNFDSEVERITDLSE
jgi:DnaJ homolog subfamily C member 28